MSASTKSWNIWLPKDSSGIYPISLYDSSRIAEKWLISANPNMFDHKRAFAKWGSVDWIQFANYEIGDTVYIYASKQEGTIRYKTIVTKINMIFSEIEKTFFKEKRQRIKKSG